MDPLTATATTLIKLFGPTLARIVFAKVLKDRVELEAISSGDIAETLADSLDIGGIVERLTNGAPSDLTPLAHLTNLQQLTLMNTQITDITPLRHLTQLRIMA